MNKIDEIRAKLEECSREKDRWSNKLIDTDDVLEIIAPYLSHGITEKEAQIIGIRMYSHSIDGKEKEWDVWSLKSCRELGLITSSREPIAEPKKVDYGEFERKQLREEPEKLMKARELIETGAYTDGGHHKQWCLERLAELFDIKLEEHEKGIAP